jgi:peptide subunit release factor 1 (eRF1)
MMSDFQKSFLSRSGMQVYTQKEFDEQLAIGKAEIMQIAIDTTKTAIAIERDECAKLVDQMRKDMEGTEVPLVLDVALEKLADQIRNRLKK